MWESGERIIMDYLETKSKRELINIINMMLDIGKVYICECGHVNQSGYICSKCQLDRTED